MTEEKAYQEAERRIEEARRSRTKELELNSDVHEDLAKLGELPESIIRLTSLQSLKVSYSRLKALPESLVSLTQLRRLQLVGNRLTILPSSLGQLSRLQSLDLSNNQLTALPKSLGQLSQLQSLNVSNNHLTALPKSLGQLSQLQSLNVSNNQLTVLPESLGQLLQLQSLDLSDNQLGTLPEWLGQLTRLESLNLSENRLTIIPEWLGQLTQLKSLSLDKNQLCSLPESLGRLTKLNELAVRENCLRSLPESISQLTQLRDLYLLQNNLGVLPEGIRPLVGIRNLYVWENKLTALPDWIGELGSLELLSINGNNVRTLPPSLAKLKKLTVLTLGHQAGGGNPLKQLPICVTELSNLEQLNLYDCQLADLPPPLAKLERLSELNLTKNPLNPELAAAYNEGLEAVKRYLRAKADGQVALNEAKLILIGEGEVGKSCLLSALRDERWVEGNPTTHGIEIKPVKIADPNEGGEIILNGWDFGGQRIYRPTHQLFFTAPAVYLVVWKPREGPQQGFVKEWISLVKHRAPDAKIIVVATHGGPKQRQPDIDRQEIWDLFGKDMVIDFLLVDSKPDKRNKRKGIAELKNAIARVAASLPEMGRKVPQRWEQTRQALKKTGAAYLQLPSVEKLCFEYKLDVDETKDFLRISHRLGHLIHYEHDPILQNIVVLKPDWLSTAISFVLDDEQTRKDHGLVSSERLGQLWNDPKRKDRYPKELHPVFLGLMERYDLSYRVPDVQKDQADETSLIAQLVPDIRPPESEFNAGWQPALMRGDVQQAQICRIVDAKNGQSATAEGLFYQLIVRLHKYSLGRVNRNESVHWQRGLVLDDDYNGRALLENVGNDVRITVRAAYPERFLSVLTREVKWLVENFWKGLRCEVTVPCMAPCGKGIPGTGLFEVEKLIAFKKQEMQKFPCYVSGCSQAQDIDSLLRNAPASRKTSIEIFLSDNFSEMRTRLDAVRDQLTQQDHQAQDRFHILDQNDRRILSQVEDAYTGLMQALTDEAKEGPRLFGFEAIDRRLFDRPKWISAKFRLTLWCEHSRLPLSALNGKDDAQGIYELDLPREWVTKAVPYLKLITGLLSLVVPVAASAVKWELDDKAYKEIAKQLEFGQKGLESTLKGAEKVEEWAVSGEAPDLDHGNAIRGQGAVLRQLHAWLKEKDPGFGGLVRVQNRRQEFLWVHPKFESEY